MYFKKQILFVVLGLFLGINYAAAQSYNPNKKYAVKELKEDFLLLRSAIEKVHPGVYWYSSKDSIHHYFDEAEKQINREMTEREFYRLILPVLVQVRCGHTYPEMSSEFYHANSNPKEYLPFELFLDGERLFIVKNGSTDSSLTEGTEILKIGNVNVAEIARLSRSLQSADGNNEAWKNKFVSLFYFEDVYAEYYDGKPPYALTVLDTAGVIRETLVTKRLKMTEPVKPKAHAKTAKQVQKEEMARQEEEAASLIKFRFTSVDSSAALLKIRGFSYENVYGVSYLKKHQSIFKMVAERKVENLVIDLRGNTGGNLNMVEDLMRYLVSKPFRSVEKNELQTSDINYLKTLSAYFAKSKRGRGFQWRGLKKTSPDTYTFHFSKDKDIKPYKKYHFDGNVYLITDGWVFSAGSLFVSSLRSQRKIIIVGEETGGAAVGCSGGRISRLVLPNTHLRVTFPHFRIYAVTEAKADGHGVIPDYIIKRSLTDISQHRDLEMKKVFELIKKAQP